MQNALLKRRVEEYIIKLVEDDAKVMLQSSLLKIKCKNASTAAFLRTHELNLLKILKEGNIKQIQYFF